MSECLLSIPEASIELRLAEVTVRRAFLDRRLPGVKIGRLVRFRAEDIEAAKTHGIAPEARKPVKAEA
jgi:excisionase family DNA binding protein